MYDLLAAKLAALREKDVSYLTALVKAGVADLDALDDRVGMLPPTVSPEVIAHIHDLIRSWRRDRGPS
jgi:hypothetical protein